MENTNSTFKALRSLGDGKGTNNLEIVTLEITPPKDDEIVIKVGYSALNYKDALCAIGHKGISYHYPRTPGIDAAGIVVDSKSDQFKIGDEVIVTGSDLGMNTDGGFGEYITVPAQWAVIKPKNLTLADSMILSTAAVTAMLSIYRMELNGINPANGSVLVTGASGGVGTMSVFFLNKLGYKVIASSGKKERKQDLIGLGAEAVIDRIQGEYQPEKPLLKTDYQAAIDTVGSTTLPIIIRQIQQDGAVAICGNVTGHSFQTNVYPFILRGCNLLGIDSAHVSPDLRVKLWHRIADIWDKESYLPCIQITDKNQMPIFIKSILNGKIFGRVLLDHSQSSTN